MECAKIKELLSEYIDGRLDAQTKALLEEHLLTCKGCKKELDSLKALVKELRSLESIKTPEDFLDKLHERVETGFTFSKIVRFLFDPPLIKIPLEFATVAAMAILIFSVLNIQQPEKQTVQMPEVSTQVRIAKKPMLDSVKPARDKEAYKPEPAFEEAVAQQSIKKREPIELALLLKTEASSKAYAPGAAMKAAPAPGKKTGVIEKESASKTYASKARISRQEAANERIKKPTDEERAMALLKQERHEFKDESVSSFSHYDETISKVKNLIRLLDGRVVSEKYEKNTNRPQFISADIPAKNYNIFCEKLKQLASLQAPPPIISEKNQEVIQIRIRFIFSK